ncbi:hypothetical protein CISG_10210 [Coccidioides immitis RMSCC 3703]|uniref:Uncharacterized protein n=1 Tax=Coccidioides immitis RMSCC 3703 TaxID=454286 RepID=A0A0J8QMN9_COCIT|nr:hypothetical protein CISG_10210 [Coccidioides immitis RMSCC 3703]
MPRMQFDFLLANIANFIANRELSQFLYWNDIDKAVHTEIDPGDEDLFTEFLKEFFVGGAEYKSSEYFVTVIHVYILTLEQRACQRLRTQNRSWRCEQGDSLIINVWKHLLTGFNCLMPSF